MTEKDRKRMKQEAIRRLEYLVSWGLDIEMLKKFKLYGRIYVNELVTSDWADRNGKKSTFPRSYIFMDTMNEVTEEMLQTKMKLENEGYLIYLIARKKRNSPVKENETDEIQYFYIDKPENKIFYEEDDDYFRMGKARAYIQIRTNTEKKDYFDEVNYKVGMSQVMAI